jgi:hypothetical protein
MLDPKASRVDILALLRLPNKCQILQIQVIHSLPIDKLLKLQVFHTQTHIIHV